MSGNKGDLNFLKSLFEEIVLFIFELILGLLQELYKDWFGTHGFTLLVLLDRARVTWFFSPIFKISCHLPKCLTLLLSWCLWTQEPPSLFLFFSGQGLSLPENFISHFLSRSLWAGLPILPRLMHCPYKVPAKKSFFWWYVFFCPMVFGNIFGNIHTTVCRVSQIQWRWNLRWPPCNQVAPGRLGSVKGVSTKFPQN